MGRAVGACTFFSAAQMQCKTDFRPSQPAHKLYRPGNACVRRCRGHVHRRRRDASTAGAGTRPSQDTHTLRTPHTPHTPHTPTADTDAPLERRHPAHDRRRRVRGARQAGAEAKRRARRAPPLPRRPGPPPLRPGARAAPGRLLGDAADTSSWLVLILVPNRASGAWASAECGLPSFGRIASACGTSKASRSVIDKRVCAAPAYVVHSVRANTSRAAMQVCPTVGVKHHQGATRGSRRSQLQMRRFLVSMLAPALLATIRPESIHEVPPTGGVVCSSDVVVARGDKCPALSRIRLQQFVEDTASAATLC